MEEKLALFDQVLTNKGFDTKPYQRDGVSWLLKNELNRDPVCGVKGGFIADEMGLGKTIMMIGLMFTNPLRHTLIILPPILIDQWFTQIHKLTGHKALVFHGSNKKAITLEDLKKSVIVLASYNEITFLGENNSLLHEMRWNRVVFDEGHHLRNNNTRRYRGAKKLNAQIRWLVTGTPIQNRKSDFYSLCSIIGLPASYYTETDNLREFARNFILKRTKKQVGIEMPDIVTENVAVLWKSKKELELCRKTHFRPNSGIALTRILRQKQVCVFPKLLKYDYPDDIEATKSSSKIDKVIDDILLNKGNMNGKLIFSHFKEEMKMIESRLIEAGMDVAVIDGSVFGEKRTELLESNKEALILQINTCCEGLNLQANYSEIYFVSPHWNPYVELQAIARCHRIGQTKTVIVKHYQMSGFQMKDNEDEDEDDEKTNIEKYIFDKQQQKINIADELFNEIS